MDRDFLNALADVTFGNPFSEQRAALVARLAPGAKLGDLTQDREALARLVAPRLEPWLSRQLSQEERRLIEPALLYVSYHRFVPQIDAHIERQAKLSGAPLAVSFGEDVMAELMRVGFSAEAAARYFAFYFQLRRTFYFIYRSLAGECESMRRLRESVWNNVFTHDMRGFEAALWNRMEDFSTLILGETGTGKGQIAAAIGLSGFIPYAIDHHDGVFERCSAHGALFLDEIGEVSIPVQIKLLQVLQERTFTPLGGRDKKRFSGRVIAATNQPLDRLRSEGRFREDFFYRLCSDVIRMPTLRERIAESSAELPLLVRLLVERISGCSELAEKCWRTCRRDTPGREMSASSSRRCAASC
jgi:Sigma-54 interaction domain